MCMCVFVVHEGTLVHAVSVLSQWTSRFTVDVPSELREWFKKAFTLKTSTSPVRHAYLQALIGAFKGQSGCWDTSDLSSCCWCLVRMNSVCVSVQETLLVRLWTSCLSSSRLWRKLLLRIPSILCCLKAWLPLCCSVGCLCSTLCPVSVHTETDRVFLCLMLETFIFMFLCVFRSEAGVLLEPDTRWKEASVQYREVPLSGQWRRSELSSCWIDPVYFLPMLILSCTHSSVHRPAAVWKTVPGSATKT